MDKTTRIHIICGFTDLDISGHQSFKNTIKYLSKFGYNLSVFSFFPKNYPTIQNPMDIFSSNVIFHRLPNVLSPILYFGKKIRDSIGRFKKEEEIKVTEKVDIYGEYNLIGRVLYIFFFFIFFLPVELLRGFFYSLKDKPDIFYGVNWYGNITASLLGRFFKKPIITRLYGTQLKQEDLIKLKTKILSITEILAMKVSSNAIIMTNDGSKGDRILKSLNVDEKRIYFWMNGLDVDDLALPPYWNPNEFKEKLGINADKKTILMVSRLALWKRVDRGIHCIFKLVKEHKMVDIILLIAGEGPDRKRVEELSESLGIRDYVRFLGGVPHNQINKYFSIADIFLSLYELSNLGNPLLEAMSFGLPIITIADGSVDYLLRDNYNSLLVKIENIENELTANARKLLEDESFRKKLGQNAKITFEEKVLTWEERIKLEDNLIKSILGNNKDKPSFSTPYPGCEN